MGMFNDNVCASRTSWKYEYTGAQLLSYAEKLLIFHTEKEIESREASAILLKDMNVNQNDSRFGELKKNITHHGTMKEQCEVFVHQFKRAPEKVYELGLGDVTFFELTKSI